MKEPPQKVRNNGQRSRCFDTCVQQIPGPVSFFLIYVCFVLLIDLMSAYFEFYDGDYLSFGTSHCQKKFRCGYCSNIKQRTVHPLGSSLNVQHVSMAKKF